MFALCRRFLPDTTREVLTTEQYVKYARDGLSRIVMDVPNSTMVQALLTMAMYEWGNGNGYGAWMYSGKHMHLSQLYASSQDQGMATRMMQSLQVMKVDPPRTEKDDEIYNRTYWACFVMDRLVHCGKSQPYALPLEQMTIHLPIGEQDFAFGVASAPRLTNKDLMANPSMSRDLETTNNFYSVLVRGFDIWARVLEFVSNGGRRQPGMNKSNNCPWVHGSPWRSIYDSLEDWRSRQSARLKYPSSPVAVQVSLGHGESFAFVNLVYYVR